uniref:Uncharacterized protein n=1 Tax=Anguilla anguilla TaxID=7936 RepID=A0A0E9XJS3_ANGAN
MYVWKVWKCTTHSACSISCTVSESLMRFHTLNGRQHFSDLGISLILILVDCSGSLSLPCLHF